MQNQKKYSLIVIILGYIFVVLAAAAVAVSTVYFVKEKSKKNVIEIIFVILYISIAVISLMMIIGACYGTMMIIKAKKIDSIYPKRTKTIDLSAGIITWVCVAVALGNMIISAATNKNDATYIVFMILINIVFVTALTATIIDTVDYVKAKKIYSKQKSVSI